MKTTARTALALFGIAPFIASAGLCIGCSGEPVGVTAVAPHVTAPSVRHVVSRARKTRLLVHTTPEAACDLSDDMAPPGEKPLRVMADTAGDVRFHYRPKPGATGIRVTLDCEAVSGEQTSYPVELAVTDGDDGEPDDNGIPKDAVLRRGLQGDLTRFTDDEILRLGFPSRPDPLSDRSRFERWAKDATRDMLVVQPVHARLGRPVGPSTHNMVGASSAAGGITTANWAGCEAGYPLPGTGAAYTSSPLDWVEGVFKIPTITNNDGGRNSTIATWIGMGGAWAIGSKLVCSKPPLRRCYFEPTYGTTPANTPLIQAGSWDEEYYDGLEVVQLFFEYWTATGGVGAEPQFASSIPNEGDTLSIYVASEDASHHLSSHGEFGYYQIVDESMSPPLVLTATIPQPPTAVPYMGEEADWIVERPIVGNNQILDLATFTSVRFSSVYAGNGLGSLFTPSQTVTMTNANQSHDYYQDPDANTLATPMILTLIPPAPAPAQFFCDVAFQNNH